MDKTTLFIDNLCCADEQRCIEDRLKTLSGIDRVAYDLVGKKIIVHHTCPERTLTDFLRNIGFPPRLSHELAEPTSFWEKHGSLIVTVTSGILLSAGILFNAAGLWVQLTDSLFIAATIVGGWQIAQKAFAAARRRSFDMNVLMVIAVAGAVAIGKYGEAAAVIMLFSLSHLLERYSTERARKRIRSLMNLSPTTATTVREGKERVENVDRIAVGEHIIIHPGERIPLDGTVGSGNSTVNQAPITGESLPVRKSSGDAVFAGSLNERGTLEVKTTKLHYDTTLARIIRKVEEAQAERAPIQSIADRFARYYTPAMIVLAGVIAFGVPLTLGQPFSVWFYRALVLLVIACPCALVISVPLTIVSGLTNAARHGVLIKGGRYLEELRNVHVVAFDKTGTLTGGTPSVSDVIPLNSLSAGEVIRLAAMIEMKSEHPLAAAVLQRAYEERATLDNVTLQHFESLTGRGITVAINGRNYFIGNHALVEEKQLCSPRVEELLLKLERDGKTTIILGTEHELLGIIAIADKIRNESRSVVDALRRHGVEKVIMVTGDSRNTAATIAESAGTDECYADLMPEAKMQSIQELRTRYGSVAMVGDGINDAPALAASTVGIAMGAGGTDVALETADIVLMSDDLTALPYLIRLSKKTFSIIKQNLAIAVVTKAAFIALGIFGITSLWMAVLADDGVTLLVILNGLRLLRFERNGGVMSREG